MVDKKFWAATFTLTGTVIGAGILGLPYVFSQAGFLTGLFWLGVLGIIVLFTNLCFGEVTLRTKEDYQIIGYAEKYLGKKGKRIAFFAFVFGIYSALIAYLIGEGQSFSMLFTGTTNYALYFALGFWIIMTLLLKKGLRGLKKIETWGVLGIIAIIFIIVFSFFDRIIIENLSGFSSILSSNFFIPFGVILFALLGFTSIPELRLELKKYKNKLKPSIFFGVIISVIIYALFSIVFVGVLGENISEVATLNFGNLVTLFGIFTMLTSYFVLSFSLKDSFKFDLKTSEKTSFLFVSLVPLLLFLLVYFFNIVGFVKILGIGGVISGGITGILILFMNKKAKKLGDRKPEFSIPLNWILIVIISLIFLAGIYFEVF